MAAFIGLLWAMLPACARFPSAETTDRNKALSMAAWKRDPAVDASARAFIRERTGLLVQGVDIAMVFPPERFAVGEPVQIWGMLKGRSVRPVGAAMVTAIAPDGYFLTAAHCTVPGPLAIVRSDATGGTYQVLQARVVWRGKPRGDRWSKEWSSDQDLAIVFAHVSQPIPAFEIGSHVPADGRVLCLGSGLASGLGPPRADVHVWSTGSITPRTYRVDDQLAVVGHDAPIGQGDSGGPVVLEDGTLAGINVAVLMRMFSGECQSASTWIDPVAVHRIIEADRREHLSDSPAPEMTFRFVPTEHQSQPGERTPE